MKRSRMTIGLVAVISLLASVIWHSPASAGAAPALESLGEVGAGQVVPSTLDVDGRGNIYVADPLGKAVFKLDQYGNLKGQFAAGQVTGRGVAVSADGGTLYAAGEDSVVIVDALTGAVTGKLAGSVAAGGEPEFMTPGEIDLDGAGFVFVADTGRQVVKVYDPAGTFQYQFGGVGSADGQFHSMVALAVNPVAGEVLVADSALERVQVFGLDGTFKRALLRGSAFGSPAPLIFAGMAVDSLGRSYYLDFGQPQLRILDAAYAYLAQSKVPVASLRDVAFDATNSRLLVASDLGKILSFGVDGGQNPVKRNVAPTIPTPAAPAGGSVVDVAAPQLQFNPATDEDGDALVYELRVLQGGAVVAAMSDLGETTVTLQAPLAENAAFSWQVRAYDGTDYSDWSNPADFVVNAVPEPPTAPTLSAPLNGEALGGADLLSWAAATDPDPGETAELEYRVLVAGAGGFAEPLLQAEVKSLDVALDSFAGYDQLVPGDVYSWRVVVFDAAGLETISADTGSFTYKPTVLTVSANMPEARVYLGGGPDYSGRFVGEAPVELRDLPAGTYSVVVETAGFEPYATTAVLAEQGTAAVSAQMVPARVPEEFDSEPVQAGGQAVIADGGVYPVLVDFDDDGILDLLVGDATGVLRLFAGNGEGYDAGVDLGLVLPPGAAPRVVDWNDDYAKDLLVGAFDGTVKLFTNSGTDAAPQFGAGVDLAIAGGTALAVDGQAVPMVTDFDGDLDKDLLVGSGTGQLVLFRNDASDARPSLAAGQVIGGFADPIAPFALDWNGDGGREILAATGQELAILGTQADGSWAAVETLPIEIPGAFAAAGWDLDGQQGKDLVVGMADGTLQVAHAGGWTLVPTFLPALAEKVLQVAAVTSDADPEAADQLAAIAAELQTGTLPLGAADREIRKTLDDSVASQEAGELLQILDSAAAGNRLGLNEGGSKELNWRSSGGRPRHHD